MDQVQMNCLKFKFCFVKYFYYWIFFLSLNACLSSLMAQDFSGFFDIKKRPNTAEFIPSQNLELELVSSHKIITPGQSFDLGVRLTHEKGWHTYWQNPGDTGLPTTIKLNFSTNKSSWKAGPIQWPAPTRFIVGSLANYGYENEVILIKRVVAPKEIVDSSVTVTASVAWLICKEVCIPGNKDLSLRLDIKDSRAIQVSENFLDIKKVKASNPGYTDDFSKNIFYSTDGSTNTFILYGLGDKTLENLEFFPLFKNFIVSAADQKYSNLVNKKTNQLGWALSVRLVENPSRDIKKREKLLGLIRYNTNKADYISVNYKNLNKDDYEFKEEAIKKFSSEGIFYDVNNLKENNLFIVLSFAFFGGIILNLMPCVFPVIGIKVMSLLDTEKGNSSRRMNALFFAFGVVCFMLAFAFLFIIIKSSGETVGWGFQMQSSPVVLGLIFLFYFMALNFFGYFEIGTSFINLSRFDKYSGPVGSFLSGGLTVLVATPCTAPFMGTALAYTLSSSNSELVLVFLILGCGIAFPFSILTLSPKLIKILPKPGGWMVKTRELLGFPMLLSAGWLSLIFVELEGKNVLLPLILALLLVFFLFWFDKNIVVQNTKTKFYFVIKVIKVCILIFVFLVVKKLIQPIISDSRPTLNTQNEVISEPSSKINSLEWKKWEKGLPEKFLANGKSVFIDFTATWCITCQVNKVRVLENEDVKQLFLDKKVVLVRADWTKKSKEIEEELKRFGRLGVPLNVFLAPGKKAVVLSEWLTKQDVSNLMISQD